MCGIAGVLRFDGGPADPGVLSSMTETLVHRGPDSGGLHTDGPAGLGHRRLTIIDTSENGRQPLFNEDRSVALTFNGEIYNFMDLRPELETRGHKFISRTDSEVIVHGYEEWGTNCLEKFNGMFAFGIWDSRKKQLFIARDRLGVKPLFYAVLPDRILFGSEIKAILADPAMKRSIDFDALSLFLSTNWTPAPYTCFKNIKSLLPGEYLIADAGGSVSTHRYWKLEYDESQSHDLNYYSGKFAELLEDSVRLRLVSDVPFGAFLSGGLDSSAVSYYMTRHMSKQLETYSIYFGEDTYDENDYARMTAKSIGCAHTEKKVTADLAKALPDIVYHSEEPLADSSMVGVYYLAREAKDKVKMVLTGDGADEILAGYETYQAYWVHRFLKYAYPFPVKFLAWTAARMMPVSDARIGLDFKMRQFYRGLAHSSEDAHACWRMIFHPHEIRSLLAPAELPKNNDLSIFDIYRDYFAETNAKSPLNRLLYVDTRLYLPSDMLVKVDRMTMAHSIEARSPFMDYRLVEFAASVPPNLKLHNLREKKFLLKHIMKDHLPHEVVFRKKQGFNVPKSRWMRKDLRDFVAANLSDDVIGGMGFLDKNIVRKLFDDHMSGKAENSYKIWALLTLSLWWQRFLSPDAASV